MLITQPLICQDRRLAEPPLYDNQYKLSGENLTFITTSQGSQYFIDEWKTGTATLAAGQLVEDVQLRYNGYIDELIWLPGVESNPVKVDKGLIRSFYLTSDFEPNNPYQFINTQYTNDLKNISPNRFVQVMYKGEISLYIFRNIEQYDQLEKKTARGTYIIPQIRPQPVYYLVTENKEVKQLNKISSRRLRNLFPSHKKEIRSILRKNNLSLKKESDLLELIPILENIL